MKRNIVVSQRWIPVDESLPELFENVLVYHPDDDDIELEWLDIGGRFFFEDIHGKATHWMPLPKPPKGVRK